MRGLQVWVVEEFGGLATAVLAWDGWAFFGGGFLLLLMFLVPLALLAVIYVVFGIIPALLALALLWWFCDWLG